MSVEIRHMKGNYELRNLFLYLNDTIADMNMAGSVIL
jgi:hypothetical protein